MPIWPVSFVDGVFQVADADGLHYPLTMQHVGIAQFNPGWEPRGLQTGLPPLHVLELVHTSGLEAVWFMDELLDYRGNGLVHLSGDDRAKFFAAVEPMAREIFEQAVRSRHDAVPAAAHNFDGFLPSSVRELLSEAVSRVIPKPELVRPGALRDVGAYGRDGITLSASRVEELLREPVPAEGAGVLDLGRHRALRRFDEGSGATTYLLQGADAADRRLYVPAAGVVFGEGDAGDDPVLPLVLFYATHLDRAVPLPEIEEIGFELIEPRAPAQHGLDEPPVAEVHEPEPVAAEPATAGYDTPEHETFEHGTFEHETFEHEASGSGAGEAEGTTYAPAARPAAEPVVEADPGHGNGSASPRGFEEAVAATGPATHPDGEAVREVTREPVAVLAEEPDAALRATPEARLAEAGRQNWWQRLLGLGHP